MARYQLTTPEVLRRLFFAANPEALKSPMKSLRGKFLVTAPLYANAGKDDIYYHLSPTAQAALELPQKFGEPVPAERRTHAYAVLLFCTSGKAPRPLFTFDEFRSVFPMVSFEGSGGAGRFFSRSYYLDTDEAGNRRLGRILVDEGGASIETLIQKCRRAFEAAEVELPLFIHERRFALALVTASPEQKTRLERELRRQPVGPPGQPLRVTVHAFPDLAHLHIAREQTARGAA